jgi:hypothetical protein
MMVDNDALSHKHPLRHRSDGLVYKPVDLVGLSLPHPHVIQTGEQEPIPASGSQSWPCKIPLHLHLHFQFALFETLMISCHLEWPHYHDLLIVPPAWVDFSLELVREERDNVK